MCSRRRLVAVESSVHNATGIGPARKSCRVSRPKADNCSAVIGPRRKMSILPPRIATIVDSIPCAAGPPSTTNGMRLPSSSRTCWAVVGLIRPNRFALGAASGFSNAWTISANIGCALTRTATVFRPAVTRSGTISCFGKTIVNGPGQNLFASCKTNCRSCAGMVATFSSQVISGRWTISGSNRGRPFASKILATAIGLSASAASP